MLEENHLGLTGAASMRICTCVPSHDGNVKSVIFNTSSGSPLLSMCRACALAVAFDTCRMHLLAGTLGFDCPLCTMPSLVYAAKGRYRDKARLTIITGFQ